MHEIEMTFVALNISFIFNIFNFLSRKINSLTDYLLRNEEYSYTVRNIS